MHTTLFPRTLADYILSGHAYLHAPTTEKTRFQAELKTLIESLPEDSRRIFVWSYATGWQDDKGLPAKTTSGTELNPPDPQKVAQEI